MLYDFTAFIIKARRFAHAFEVQNDYSVSSAVIFSDEFHAVYEFKLTGHFCELGTITLAKIGGRPGVRVYYDGEFQYRTSWAKLYEMCGLEY